MTHFVLLGLVVLGDVPELGSQTLPMSQRPEWVRRDGIVMAGSWEPLLFRVRRDGAKGYTPTPEQRRAYEVEHSHEVITKLKNLGVNFIMMHCYKGAGLEAEAQSMREAVEYAGRYHEAGLRVGVYNYSGAFLWEPLFQENPAAREWVLHGADGKPVPYGRATYRYYWNRNHPDAVAYYRKIVRFAVEEIRTDLVHFDNYHVGPGLDEASVRAFRRYLREAFSPRERTKMGVEDVDSVLPPMKGLRDAPLYRAWQDFRCRWLARSYHEMGAYARSLRKDVLVECNPAGVRDRIRPPVDHGRLLPGGEAFWSEGGDSGFRKGKLESRIRTYKVGRRLGNMVFAYTRKPLEIAEAMAFNLDCIGCICWFEYGKLTNYPGSRGKPIDPAIGPYVEFFHKRRDLLRGAKVVADVAVLRSFPSQVFADPKNARQTYLMERTLIHERAPFQIIYDQQLDALNRYRALVLAGCAAMTDAATQRVRAFVEQGGRILAVGSVATLDGWALPREADPFADLPSQRFVRVEGVDGAVAALGRMLDGGPSLCVKRPDGGESFRGLCAELTELPGRRLVHLVDYREGAPATSVQIDVRLPKGRRAESVKLVGPDHEPDGAVAFRQEGDRVRFSVPTVRIYEIAVVSHAAAR